MVTWDLGRSFPLVLFRGLYLRIGVFRIYGVFTYWNLDLVGFKSFKWSIWGVSLLLITRKTFLWWIRVASFVCRCQRCFRRFSFNNISSLFSSVLSRPSASSWNSTFIQIWSAFLTSGLHTRLLKNLLSLFLFRVLLLLAHVRTRTLCS